MDLGADGWQTFRFVTFPVLSTALVAGALLAFALSFDEVIVTTFTAGAQNTLPIWILGNLRLGQQLPAGERRRLFRDSDDRDSRDDRAAPDARHGDPAKEVIVSTTVSKHQNLIGGEWVDASSGETMEVLNPSTGEVIAEVPRASRRRRRPCGPGGEESPCRVARDHARRARRDAAQAGGRAGRARGRDRRARVAERRQAALVCEGRDSGRNRQHPLLRRRRPRARRQVSRRVHARLHLLAAA